MLIVFSGLPGTGKTTIAQKLAARKRAVYLRIDTLEQTLRNAEPSKQDVGRTGYTLANELALSNLHLGNTVIVDGVNPVAESRDAWREIASRADARLFDVQVICSDKAEHQRRVEQRQANIPGLTPPSWASVLAHEYEPWETTPFCVDTAGHAPEQAVSLIMQRIGDEQHRSAENGPAPESLTTPVSPLETEPANVRVRSAEPEDLPRLLELYRHLNPDDPQVTPDKANAQLGLLRQYPGSGIFVAEVKGEFVATCTLVVIPNLARGARPYALIENVVTHSEHRRMGYGKHVLQHAIDAAWRADCYKVMLLTGAQRPAVHQFYRAAGFEQNKTGFQIRRIAARG